MVIHLGDMTPGPHLGEELLAGKEPVHQEMQGAVQPVQEINLSLTVMPVISHELADDRVVLLFHMGIVILVIRTGPDNAPRLGQKGSGVRVISRVWQKRTRWPFMTSVPLSAWREITCPGYRRRHDSRAATTYTSAFVRTAPASVHPVLRSVTVRVQLKSPTACPPSCPTRSTARAPGISRGSTPRIQ